MQQQLQKQLSQSVASIQAVEDKRNNQTTSISNQAQKGKKVQKSNSSHGSSGHSATSTIDSINIQPKCPSKTGSAAATAEPLAIPPGSIANQMMNRKARQGTTVVKKKDKPNKVKKVKPIGLSVCSRH